MVVPRAGVRQRDFRPETRVLRRRNSLQLFARLDGRRRPRPQRHLARTPPSGLLSDPALRLPDLSDEDSQLDDGQQDGGHHLQDHQRGHPLRSVADRLSRHAGRSSDHNSGPIILSLHIHAHSTLRHGSRQPGNGLPPHLGQQHRHNDHQHFGQLRRRG